MADADDRQGGRGGGDGHVLGDDIHCGATATPQGRRPTWIDLITFSAATSMTETSLESPLVASRYLSSGANAICQTRWPTSRYFSTSPVLASTTATRLAGPRATKAVRSSRVKRMPTGWMTSDRRPWTSK